MFTWKEGKREKVLKKHKVDFEKIKDIFDDPFSIDFTDYEHSSEDETRYAKIAFTAEYGLVFLIYTETEFDAVGFVTAGRAENWTAKEYERRKRKY